MNGKTKKTFIWKVHRKAGGSKNVEINTCLCI